MKFGLQINSFTWPGGPNRIGETLARVTRTALYMDAYVEQIVQNVGENLSVD